MNTQFTLGLSESFARQEHERLLKIAADARLARQATQGSRRSRSFFTLRKPAQNPKPAPESGPQPSVTKAASIAILTALLAIQSALWLAF